MKNITLLSLLMMLVFSLSLYAADCKTTTSTFVDMKISGMTCENCVHKVKTSLEKVDGVSKVDVALAGHTAQVTFDANKTSAEKLREAVKTSGFEVKAVQANPAKPCCAEACSCKTADCNCEGACSCCASASCCAMHRASKI